MRQTLKNKANIIRKYATQKAEINKGKKQRQTHLARDLYHEKRPKKWKCMRKTPRNRAKTEPHPQKIDVSSQKADVHWWGQIQTPLFYIHKVWHQQQTWPQWSLLYNRDKLHLPPLCRGAMLASPNPNTHLWFCPILIATFALLSMVEWSEIIYIIFLFCLYTSLSKYF